MKRKGIDIRTGQTWRITKGFKKRVEEINRVTIGNTVRILSTFGGYGLISVMDLDTKLIFDVNAQNLSELLS